jgi:Uma2 family endonuclease
MARVLSEPATVDTFAELWERLGKVPLDRILMHPAPGTATPADVLRLADAAEKRLCELVDGVLVAKTMGQRESRLALRLGQLMMNYLFAAGVELVWYIDPAKRTVRVYTSVDSCTVLRNGDTLDGGEVLPGFHISIREMFEKARKIRPGRR